MKSKSINGTYCANQTANCVNKLPSRWRDWFIETQWKIFVSQPKSNRGNGLLALAILSATGCVPNELESGFRLSLLTDDLIKITFCRTPKTSIAFRPNHTTSQAMEEIEIRHVYIRRDNTDPAIRLLFGCFHHAPPVNYAPIRYQSDRLTKLIRSLSEKYDKEFKISSKNLKITPKSFRHEFSAQLFMSGLYTIKEISLLLGLKNESSLLGYACWSRTPPAKIRLFEVENHG